MSCPSLIDGQTNEQTGAVVLLLRACWLGAGCWVRRCGGMGVHRPETQNGTSIN